MNISQLKNLKLTNHSHERYYQRVARAPIGTMDDEMHKWFKTAISQGLRLPEPGENNTTLHVYQGHKVVYNASKNTAVTVHPYKPYADKDSGYHVIKDEIGNIVERKLTKSMRALKHQHRQTLIALHKEEIKRLSVYNPNTQDTIAKRVLDIQKQVVVIERQIDSVEVIAEQYGIIL